MLIYALFIDCRESHLRTFCREIHQCARIGGWGLSQSWQCQDFGSSWHWNPSLRTIYVNIDTPNLGFTYFNFLGGYQWKKSPCRICFKMWCKTNRLCITRRRVKYAKREINVGRIRFLWLKAHFSPFLSPSYLYADTSECDESHFKTCNLSQLSFPSLIDRYFALRRDGCEKI